MSLKGRNRLGREWKRKLEENAKGAKHVIPHQVTMEHPYIKEAMGKPEPAAEKVEPPKADPPKTGLSGGKK